MAETAANLAGSFKFNAGMFNMAVEGIAPESWLLSPGNKSNHLLWIAGHVVWSRKMVLQVLGTGCPRPWEKLFARGAKPVDPVQYPKPEEILAAWAEVSGKLDSALDGASPQFLSEQAPPSGPSFDGRMSGTIAFFSAHESYHIGQMGYLRKWLGYSQAVG